MELQLAKDPIRDRNRNPQVHPLKRRLVQCRRNPYVWSLGRITFFRNHSISIIVISFVRTLPRSCFKLFRLLAHPLRFRPSIHSCRCNLKLQVLLLRYHPWIRIFYVTPVIFSPAYLLRTFRASHRNYCNITQPCMPSICARSSLSAVILTFNRP